MSGSITVTAFVFGLVLIIAALLGKELKIAAVELPSLNRTQRLIAGVLGIVLVIFGVTEGKVFNWTNNQSPTPQSGLPTPASLNHSDVPLPPEFAGNIRSAKANYGCGVLVSAASSDEQLSICGSMPELPLEWTTKVSGVNVDCATAASDRIIVEVWTAVNYSGDRWAYTFGC